MRLSRFVSFMSFHWSQFRALSSGSARLTKSIELRMEEAFAVTSFLSGLLFVCERSAHSFIKFSSERSESEWELFSSNLVFIDDHLCLFLLWTESHRWSTRSRRAHTLRTLTSLRECVNSWTVPIIYGQIDQAHNWLPKFRGIKMTDSGRFVEFM